MLYSHNLGSFKTSSVDGLQEVSTAIISMPQRVFAVDLIIKLDPRFNYWTQWLHEWNVMPFSSIGMNVLEYSHYNFEEQANITTYPVGWGIYFFVARNRFQTLPAPHVISYYGMQTGILPSAHNYPCALSGAYNARGIAMDTYSGAWNNPESLGLYTDWWLDFVKYIANSISVEWDVLLDAITYNKIDINATQFIVDNLRWFCKKASIVMPFPERSKLTLVRT
jgi:hypothetical protein